MALGAHNRVSDWREMIDPALEKTRQAKGNAWSAEDTESRKGNKRWKCGKWGEYMTDVDGDVSYFLPPTPNPSSEDFWRPNPSSTVHHSSTFPSTPSKGQAGRGYITITHLLEKQLHRSAEDASWGTNSLSRLNRCFSTTRIYLFVK